MTKLRLSNYSDEYLADMSGKSKTHEAASDVRKVGVFSICNSNRLRVSFLMFYNNYKPELKSASFFALFFI
jgi:hypothetical protein